MPDTVEVKVPDIGDFTDVPIIEVLVAAGDTVAPEDPLIVLESDKATMDVPSPSGGTVAELRVEVGDTVSEGSLIMMLEPEAAEAPAGGDGAVSADASESAEERVEQPAAAEGDSDGQPVEVKVPDIGDFSDVPIIEVLVEPGAEVAAEDPLITLESDKATMDVPSPSAGVVRELKVAVGDAVSEGSLILLLEPEGAAASAATGNGAGPAPAEESREQTTPAPTAPDAADIEHGDVHAQVLVLGSGPGGYTAAFRAADLGLETVLVERYDSLGGVCLNVGCIPSKALLHVARMVSESEEAATQGIAFGDPEIDLDKLRDWKQSVVGKLTGGLQGLAKQRKVQVVQGRGEFSGPHMLAVEGGDGKPTTVSFEHCIIACGSQATHLPGFPDDDPRMMDSTDALELADIPDRLLVVGGGIIGLEMACVYDALGAEVTVVELLDGLIPGCDRDLVRPLQKRIEGRYAGIHLATSVTSVEPTDEGLKVSFEGEDAPEPQVYDRVLQAVGRRPNGALIGAEAAGVNVDDRGFIDVDDQQRTNVSHIFAIGDVVGEPMLAHKATHEGKVAAEVIAGHDVTFDARSIPSVAYTDPEVAWTGLTETEAKEQGVKVEKASVPWAASGRALASGRSEGMTKLLVDPETRRVLGGGIVGINAGELIAEVVHAIEMGADAEDIGLSIHPHPTLSETVAFAADTAAGTITDLPNKKAAKAAAR